MGDDNNQTRSEAEWDVEIEADFARTVAKTRAGGKRKRSQRLIGCPVGFLADVCRLTKGRAPVVVAVCIYRRTHVCNSKTVTLPNAELKEFGIDHTQKCRALRGLEAAGLIRIEKAGQGRAAVATLLWQAA